MHDAGNVVTPAGVHQPLDYGARDAAIRCQTYSPVRRLEGLRPKLFANYWRDVHGPLCSRLPGLGFYVQHHFSRSDRANLWLFAKGVKEIEFELDGAVEIGFANDRDMQTFSQASPLLFGDEVNIFAWDAAYFLPNGSRTYVDRQADPVPNGPDRLHRLHVYMHGALDDAFRSWIAAFAGQLVTSPAVQKLRLHVPEAYDNARPQPPSPVDHVVPDDLTRLAVMEIGFANALCARRFFESEVYRSTLDGQSEHLLAMKVVLVTGVYTFVRDGLPTTAGLRGSRPAEVIEQVGATNHLAHEVTKLFRPRP